MSRIPAVPRIRCDRCQTTTDLITEEGGPEHYPGGWGTLTVREDSDQRNLDFCPPCVKDVSQPTVPSTA